MTSMIYNLQLRVYYEDTDAGGIVYHGKYIAFMERARSEILLQNNLFSADGKYFFVVRRVEADYLIPAKLFDQLIVETKITGISKTSITFGHTIYKKDYSEIIFCKGLVTVVCVNAKIKPIRLPELLRSLLQSRI